MAAREMISRGYKRIGFMGGPEKATSTRDRLTGFLDEAGETPGITASHSFAGDYRFAPGRDEMRRLIAEGPAEAYFCGDDVLTIGALSAAWDAGLRVPEDIGFIGLNDMEMSGWDNLALTTIRQPIPEIVEATIELVMEMLGEEGHVPASRVFPCEVVERKTLRPVS
jgi:DNA-binding LacI/PurR family transcriptional regulator